MPLNVVQGVAAFHEIVQAPALRLASGIHYVYPSGGSPSQPFFDNRDTLYIVSDFIVVFYVCGYRLGKLKVFGCGDLEVQGRTNDYGNRHPDPF